MAQPPWHCREGWEVPRKRVRHIWYKFGLVLGEAPLLSKSPPKKQCRFKQNSPSPLSAATTEKH